MIKGNSYLIELIDILPVALVAHLASLSDLVSSLTILRGRSETLCEDFEPWTFLLESTCYICSCFKNIIFSV